MKKRHYNKKSIILHKAPLTTNAETHLRLAMQHAGIRHQSGIAVQCFDTQGKQHIFHPDFILGSNHVIEVDGATHNWRQEKDLWRTTLLNRSGYTVTRFTDKQVTRETEKCIRILQALEGIE